MPSAAHEIAIQVIAEQPQLLGMLTERLLGRALSTELRVADSAARFVETEEARPDLLLEGEHEWVALEVQRQVDPEKARRWLVMMAIKASQSDSMGDLVVLTPSRAVAEWAASVSSRSGRLGTRLELAPIVLLLDDDALALLLDEAHPELAFFAAWGVQTRYGPEARQVVVRALELSTRLPEALQGPMQRSIIGVLHEKMFSYVQELVMQLSDMPMGPVWRMLGEEFLQKGRAEAYADAVLTLLAARGLAVSSEQRAHVLSCSDAAVLVRYLRRAATATTTAEALE